MRLDVCIDVNDIEREAEFWLFALDYERGKGDGKPYLNLMPKKDESGPIVFLQLVPEKKTIKNRVHLDIYTENPQELVEKLVAKGAKRLGPAGSNEEAWWQVLADPEGNEFCVSTLRPTESYRLAKAQEASGTLH